MFASTTGRKKTGDSRPHLKQAAKTRKAGPGGVSAFASASIIAKTMVLLAVFIIAVGSVNLYIRAQISHSSEAVDAQSAALNDLQTVRTTAKAFDDLRYWYADLANSLSEESEKAADAASARLNATLTHLENRFAADVASIRDHVAKLGEASLAALDEYVMDNRDQGNTHMADGRKEIAEVDRIIAALVETLTREAGEKGQAVQAAAADALRFSVFGIAIPVVFAVIVGFVLIMFVARPVRSMTEVTRRLASGDLDRDVPAVRTRDEIGQMADALGILRDNLREAEQMRLAQDEAQERVREERRAAMLAVADEMEQAVSICATEISEAATRLQQNAKQMSEVARGTDRQSSSAVGSAEEAAQHIASVASATNELSASINEVVHEIERSAGMARNAVKLSKDTSGVVDRLSVASDRIDSVVQLINDIAEQTNLLALNATIEAARAGEAGRGFAIVASEVKSLAVQTTGATTDIRGQIQEIKSIADGSVSAMGQVQQVILDIENRISSLAAAAEQQNVTTQGISQNIGDVAHNARTISTVVHDIAEAAKITGVASEGTHSAAAQLAGQAEVLKNSVQELIGRLRANG